MSNNIALKGKFYDSCFKIINYFILSLVALMCVYPLYYILVYSISIPARAEAQILFLLPQGFSLESYIQIFGAGNIPYSAFISVSRSVVGTVVTIICTSMFAFTLTKEALNFRKVIYRFVIFTMYFTTGLIPWYMLMRSLGLKDNFLLYIIPTAIVPFYLVLVKVYIEQLPPSLQESAVIDGANSFDIFIKIILPVCKPVLATVAIFASVGQWNTWWDSFLLAKDMPTLQLVLLRVLSEVNKTRIMEGSSLSSSLLESISPKTVRMAMTVITVLPVIIVYPFFQRYFIKGIMIGAVKG